jgi:hypothetical protein
VTTTLRESLARGIDGTTVPGLNVATLIGAGEARLRRRRFAAVAGSAVAAAVVVAAIALGAALNNPDHRSDGPPVDHPRPSPTETSAPAVRELLYSDIPSTYTGDWPSPRKGTIHFGERAIETRNAFVHLDVTDEGFVYTNVAGVQFSDGDRTVQIGSRLCVPGNGVGLHMAQDAVMTGAAGSLVAWFACEDPKSPALVVYDTGAGREVAHQAMPFCATVAVCQLDDVVGDHIYFTRIQYDTAQASLRHVSYDVTTGSQNPATSRSYADDIRSNPRRLVVGDTWETAIPTASLSHLRGGKRGSLVFRAVGTRLVALWGEANGESPTTIFDTATHQTVQLLLPPDYHPSTNNYGVFEWLDDDTVALTPEHNLSSADIITCRLSEGRCRLAVKAGPDGLIRIMPATGLPG